MRPRPEHLLTLGVVFITLVALSIALLTGSVAIPATEVARLLVQDDGSITDRIIDQLRPVSYTHLTLPTILDV